MTNVTNLPRQKPGLGQLHVPRAAVSEYVGNACGQLLHCQSKVLATDTAESLAAAIEEAHSIVIGHGHTLAELVESTRHWRK